MSSKTDHRRAIAAALWEFRSLPMASAAVNLLWALGYKSDRSIHLASSSPRAFLDFIHTIGPVAQFDESKALCSDWKSADLLFQITDDELSGYQSLFKDTKISPQLVRSYLFFAIELEGAAYTRGQLTSIARQINKVFPMPVMLLIKHLAEKRPVLSIAVINRRQSMRDSTKDVLGKVTIVRDISIGKPHRGHLDILDSLAISNLVHPQRLPIDNFVALHEAWEEIFNIELLNRRFYRELANWYFWALPQVEFPCDTEKDAEKLCATSLIRLVTRLIFCWFLKEKGLIPEKLFVKADVSNILKDLSEGSSTYYQAILQNLFFATLNQRMGSDKYGRPYRTFQRAMDSQKENATYVIDHLYRYEEHFVDGDAAIEYFSDVPFLNGGLFECLDTVDVVSGKKTYLDGYSRNQDKRASVPNHLFFSNDITVDLSDAYGERRRRNERVRGLLRILHSYKFTIVENSPIDQEIALDPELLGKVFENLLASYNEETQTTARKQTGSFYTPREIVDYMVDAALKAHLTSALLAAGLREKSISSKLDNLFAYSDRPHSFTERHVEILLDTIHTCKILDPACGSGAFIMGMLQKLVYVINKLDPDNSRWKKIQIDAAEKIPDFSARTAAIAAIERDFADNEDDYGRKHYLIENCLYGVDIQPIAIQISKLRFFISLVCDQRTNRDKAQNFGVRPLPNLETKFVAADTLVGLPEATQMSLVPRRVSEIEMEIENLYHSYFAAQRPDRKFRIQRQVEDLRTELAALHVKSMMPRQHAKRLADWNAFDPQASSDFFDAHWMFGRSLEDGFDIVFGNPPYQSAIEHKKAKGETYRSALKQQYEVTVGTWDLYIAFFEAGIRLLKPGGVLSYISPNKFLSARYGMGLRKYILNNCTLVSLADVSHLPVFESASVYPVISVIRKECPPKNYEIGLHLPITRSSPFSKDEYVSITQNSGGLTLLPNNLWGFLLSPQLRTLEAVLEDVVTLETIAQVHATTTAAEADKFGATLRSAPSKGWKTLNTGTIDPFCTRWDSQAIRHQGKSILRPILPNESIVSTSRRKLFSSPKLIFAKMGLRFEGYVDRKGEYAALNCNCATNPDGHWTLDALAVVLHSSVIAFAYRQYFDALRMAGGYLPFQAPQLRIVPFPKISKSTAKVLDTLGRLRAFAARASVRDAIKTFLADLSDACVMECYFSEHMAARELSLLADIGPHLIQYDTAATFAEREEFIRDLHDDLNSASATTRNRLVRLTADSPNVLGVIKAENVI